MKIRRLNEIRTESSFATFPVYCGCFKLCITQEQISTFLLMDTSTDSAEDSPWQLFTMCPKGLNVTISYLCFLKMWQMKPSSKCDRLW
jgi:hypothetical protein